MNKEEAKLLLCVCRPCGADDAEPIMQEARECIDCDPAAKEEVQQARALDAQLSEKLSCICVPACLKTEILAGARLGRSGRGFLASYGRWLAVAAAVVLALSTTLWTQQQKKPQLVSETTDLQTFRDESAVLFTKLASEPLGYKADLLTHDSQTAQRYFAAQSACCCELPADGVLACRVINWRGHRLGICCMKQGEHVAHLFMLPSSAVKEGMAEIERAIVQIAGRPVTVWRDGHTVRALVGDKAETQLQPFLVAQR